jgi:hypothetical protein
MSDPLPNAVCPRCGTAAGASDNYCHQCGAALAAAGAAAENAAVAGAGPPAAAAAHSAAKPAEQPGWAESPWLILPLLFLILGPLAFGMLWRSRRFPRPWKIVLTVVVTGLTVWVGWELWLLFRQVQALVHELTKPEPLGGF